MSDIVLEDTSDQVTVIGANLKFEGHDFLLDSPERRKNSAGYRRALVHDTNDGLTINFSEDYPGGVTINDVRTLDVRGDIQFRISHKDEILLRGGHPPDEIVKLGDVIKTLRQEIADLHAQIAKLTPKL